MVFKMQDDLLPGGGKNEDAMISRVFLTCLDLNSDLPDRWTETKKQYFDCCKNFDWYFDFSDDYFGVALPGKQQQQQRLEQCYIDHPEWRCIYVAWHDYHYSGDNWGKEQAPKPTYEMFGIKGDKE